MGVSLLGVIGAWAALSGSKKPDADNRASRQEQEQPPPKAANLKGSPKVDNSKGSPKVDNSKGSPKVTPKVENPPPKAATGKEVPVYKFDAAEVMAFQVRQKGGGVLEGKKGTLPKGIAIYTLKDAEAEFEAGKVEGTAAFSMTRRAAGGDTHIAFELERDTANQGMGLKLRAESDHKVRVKYRTDGAAQIGIGVHPTNYKPGGAYKVFGSTGDKWVTVELPFRRTIEPMRLTISAVGASDVQISIATVEVLEILPTMDGNGDRGISWLDLGGPKPLAIWSGPTVDAHDPNRKNNKPISRTGAGGPAAG